MRHTVSVGLIILAALAGCSHVPPGPPATTAAAAQPVASPGPPPVPPQSASAPATAIPDARPSTPVDAAAPTLPQEQSRAASAPKAAAGMPAATVAPAPPPPGRPNPAAAASTARPAAPPAPAPKPAATPAATVAPAAAATPAAPPAAPSLDLAALEQRLRDTRAIGLFTKLSLKNQVDELLTQFRAYHRGDKSVPPSLLRQRYDGLLMKVLSVLQDGDPPLATQIWSSREVIWSVLADPAKFEKI